MMRDTVQKGGGGVLGERKDSEGEGRWGGGASDQRAGKKGKKGTD